MLPDVENLRCFLEVARLLNFRAAARSVALTPAALSARIKQLEEQLGTRLFARTTRSVALTESGLRLLPQAQRALEEARRCLIVGRGEGAPIPTELTLGTRHELGMSWIRPMLPVLSQKHPGLTVHLYFGSGHDLLIRVRTLEIDVAVGSMRITDSKLDSIRLHREEYVLVGSPQLLKKNPLNTVEDARRHTLVDATAELPLYGYLKDSADAEEPVQFGASLRMGTIAAIRETVLAAHGVAVLPLYLVEGDLKARRLARALPQVTPLHDHFRLVFRADDPRRALYASIAESMLAIPLA